MRITFALRPACLTSSNTSLLIRPIFNFSSSSSSYSSFPFTIKPKRTSFHFLKPCSSLRQTKKRQQTLQKTPANAPQNLKCLLNLDAKSNEEGTETGGDDSENGAAVKGTILAGILLVGVVGGFGTVGYIYRDQINVFLTQFSGFIEVVSLQKPMEAAGFSTESPQKTDSPKKMRGRPRKYAQDLSSSPGTPLVTHDNSGGGGTTVVQKSEPSSKKPRDRPTGTGKKQLDTLGVPGVGLTAHVIAVDAGEQNSRFQFNSVPQRPMEVAGFSTESPQKTDLPKKKRGRPRKYAPNGNNVQGLSSLPKDPVVIYGNSGGGVGTARQDSELSSKKPRRMPSGVPGVGFTPHVIAMDADEINMGITNDIFQEVDNMHRSFDATQHSTGPITTPSGFGSIVGDRTGNVFQSGRPSSISIGDTPNGSRNGSSISIGDTPNGSRNGAQTESSMTVHVTISF